MRLVSIAAVTAGLVLQGGALAFAADAPPPAAEFAAAMNCGFEPPRGSNGDKPAEPLLRQLIACRWQQPERPGIAGPVRVRLDEILLSPSRRWGEPSDIGLGYLHTRVWPVTAQYAKQSEQLGKLSVEEGRAAFNCFVNTSRHWQCLWVERLPDRPGAAATQTVAR